LTPVPAAWVKQERLKQTVAQQGRSMRAQAAIEIDDLERRLQQWTQRCPICYMDTIDAQISMHTIAHCAQDDADQVRSAIREMTRAMRDGRKYARFSCCYICGVPQVICQRYESNGNGGWRVIAERECQFCEIVIPVVVSASFIQPGGCMDSIWAWMHQDGVYYKNKEDVYTWMGQKVRWSGMECTRMMQVFYWISESIIQ
jgi:hypothetical protein